MLHLICIIILMLMIYAIMLILTCLCTLYHLKDDENADNTSDNNIQLQDMVIEPIYLMHLPV